MALALVGLAYVITNKISEGKGIVDTTFAVTKDFEPYVVSAGALALMITEAGRGIVVLVVPWEEKKAREMRARYRREEEKEEAVRFAKLRDEVREEVRQELRGELREARDNLTSAS